MGSTLLIHETLPALGGSTAALHKGRNIHHRCACYSSSV